MVADATTPQLVQLGLLHPLDTLGHRRLERVQLEALYNLVEIGSVEADDVLDGSVIHGTE